MKGICRSARRALSPRQHCIGLQLNRAELQDDSQQDTLSFFAVSLCTGQRAFHQAATGQGHNKYAGGHATRLIHTSSSVHASSDKPDSSQTLQARLQAAGWSRQEVINAPNTLCMLRALSGPCVAYLISQDMYAPALALLAAAGATDWLDGFLARRWNQGSVLGSYLDPLADKVLMISTVGALAYQGLMPLPAMGVIAGRDVLLLGGAFYLRSRSLPGQAFSLASYFKLRDGAAPARSHAPQTGASTTSGSLPQQGIVSGVKEQASAPTGAQTPDQADEHFSMDKGRHSFIAAHRPLPDHPSPQQAQTPQSSSQDTKQGPQLSSRSVPEASASAGSPPASLMKPLFISKANTVLQLAFVTSCLAVPAVGVPSEEGLYWLGACTAVSTVASGAAYLPMLWKSQGRTSRE